MRLDGHVTKIAFSLIPPAMTLSMICGLGNINSLPEPAGAQRGPHPHVRRRLCAKVDRGHCVAVHGALPPGLFDLVVGINRWSYRLVVYVALMTDRYPQFRLDQGSIDVEGPAQPPAAMGWRIIRRFGCRGLTAGVTRSAINDPG